MIKWAVEGFDGECWEEVTVKDTWKEAWDVFITLLTSTNKINYRVIRRRR